MTSVLALLSIGACARLDTLLEVDVPGVVPADRVEVPQNASALMEAVAGTYDCALVRFIIAGGFIGEELGDAAFTNFTFSGLIRRDPVRSAVPTSTDTCDSWFALYTPISQARWVADHTIQLLEGWTDAQVPQRQAKLARAYAYSGYGHILLGEMYCSAAIDGGPQLKPFEVFARAEAKFTKAIELATAAGDQAVLNLARVGRARVRLNQGKTAEALQDAKQVPSGFVFNTRYSDQSWRTRNVFYPQNYIGTQFTIDVPYRNLTFQGVADPRVSVTDMKIPGGDGVTPLWRQNKYTTPATPIPVARWAEAQLIIAEIEGGASAVSVINDLHTRARIPLFQSTDPAAIKAQVSEERKRELFLEGQRLYDVIRLKLPLFHKEGDLYKAGQTSRYGKQLCQPIPAVETENNPNIPEKDVIWDIIRG